MSTNAVSLHPNWLTAITLFILFESATRFVDWQTMQLNNFGLLQIKDATVPGEAAAVNCNVSPGSNVAVNGVVHVLI